MQDNNNCKTLTLPDIIEYDGINVTNIAFNYQIFNNEEKEKEVKLIWKNKIPNSTNCLFQECSSITQIDLSNYV